MKKLLLVMLVFSLLLIAGCKEEGGEAGTTATKATSSSGGKYSGFMEWKAGMWAETVSKQDGQTITMRTELIENSPSLAKFQMTTDANGQESVMQIWFNPGTNKATKYVMKAGGQVMCLDIKDVPQENMPSKGEDYDADLPGWTTGTYTTPTGKTLAVAKFSQEGGEYWVSSEVPFGMVKAVVNGKTVLSLNDFGAIGAKSKISESEIEGCTDLSKLASKYQQPSVPAPEEEAAGEEDPDYAARTYEGGTGADVGFDCADCEGMPPAAKSACLAACR
jgi:outer membrane lipoprotein-sorting protein